MAPQNPKEAKGSDAELEQLENELVAARDQAFELGLDEAGIHAAQARIEVVRELWRRAREAQPKEPAR